MQVIGFNFKKIFAERFPEFKQNSAINTSIEFTNLEKDKVDLLKDIEAIQVSFKFSISYSDSNNKDAQKPSGGEIAFEGNILISATKDESKEIMKYWKKKQLPNGIKISLFNLILKKCTPKALDLEDEVNLPSHIPLPQLRPKSQEEGQ